MRRLICLLLMACCGFASFANTTSPPTAASTAAKSNLFTTMVPDVGLVQTCADLPAPAFLGVSTTGNVLTNVALHQKKMATADGVQAVMHLPGLMKTLISTRITAQGNKRWTEAAMCTRTGNCQVVRTESSPPFDAPTALTWAASNTENTAISTTMRQSTDGTNFWQQANDDQSMTANPSFTACVMVTYNGDNVSAWCPTSFNGNCAGSNLGLGS